MNFIRLSPRRKDRPRVLPSLLAFSVLLAGMIGCAASDRMEEAAGSSAATESAMTPAQVAEGKLASNKVDSTADVEQTKRLVIRKAEVFVRVEDVEKAEKKSVEMVNRFGGYISGSQSYGGETQSVQMTIRIPVASFDTVLGEIDGMGVRLSRTIETEDVTAQVVDLDARVKTLSAQEETLRSILKGTRDLKSMLEVQTKLTELRAQIESMAAQRKALAGLASLSTICVTYEQSAVPHAGSKDPNWLSQAWGTSTSAFASFGRGLVTLLVWLGVFSPIWLPIGFLGFRLMRPLFSNGQKAPPRVL